MIFSLRLVNDCKLFKKTFTLQKSKILAILNINKPAISNLLQKINNFSKI